MIRSVLVPLDGSSFGEHALPYAAQFAHLAQATLHLLHVHQPVNSSDGEGSAFFDHLPTSSPEGMDEELGFLNSSLDEVVCKNRRIYLEQIGNRLQGYGPIAINTIVLEGEVVPSIHEAITENKVDLVVMTTHGRGPLQRFWLGSVASSLLHEVATPLLMVHPKAEAADLARKVSLRRILLPLDGSSLAEEIIAPSQELAGLLGAELELLHVLKPVQATSYALQAFDFGVMDPQIQGQIDTFQEGQVKKSQKYLERLATQLNSHSISTTAKVLIADQAVPAILHEAEKSSADLISLKTHGRRGLARMLLGSVADKVVRSSHIPVLVQRPKKS